AQRLEVAAVCRIDAGRKVEVHQTVLEDAPAALGLIPQSFSGGRLLLSLCGCRGRQHERYQRQRPPPSPERGHDLPHKPGCRRPFKADPRNVRRCIALALPRQRKNGNHEKQTIARRPNRIVPILRESLWSATYNRPIRKRRSSDLQLTLRNPF